MATAGPNHPGDATTDSAVGTVDWSDPANILASDNVRAQVSLNSQTSYYLVALSFGFAIDSSATILGVTAAWERSSPFSPGNITDASLKLWHAGAPIGSDKADLVTVYPTTDTVATYGGAADLWGATLTYSIVNAVTFGVALSCKENAGVAKTAQVDDVQLTITYAGPGGIKMLRRLMRRPPREPRPWWIWQALQRGWATSETRRANHATVLATG